MQLVIGIPLSSIYTVSGVLSVAEVIIPGRRKLQSQYPVPPQYTTHCRVQQRHFFCVVLRRLSLSAILDKI